MKFLPGLLLASALCFGQQAELPEGESKDLQAALSQTSNSPREIARTLEKHLQKYPNSAQKEDMERAIVKYSMETGDKTRTVIFGERVLEKSLDEPQILERVAEILLESADTAKAERALKYAAKFETILRALEKEGPSAQRRRAQLLEELDRALARALALQARAAGIVGRSAQAIELAKKGYDTYPTAAGARELARQYEKAGRTADAVRLYAEAFHAIDSKNSDADRARDRARMAELHGKDKPGLGDIVLAAYDRVAEANARITAKQRQRDPNARVTEPMEFTLSAVEGKPLPLASLKGKVVVLDFWATWCGPCRVQHPLYEEVKKRFHGRDDVVFLAINTDEDPSLVKPFLEQNGWSRNVYFEDGLSQLMRVSSIPTTVVIDKNGEIHSRMNGFVPDKFVDQLTGIIREAL